VTVGQTQIVPTVCVFSQNLRDELDIASSNDDNENHSANHGLLPSDNSDSGSDSEHVIEDVDDDYRVSSRSKEDLWHVFNDVLLAKKCPLRVPLCSSF
jgi:hypothetical protein